MKNPSIKIAAETHFIPEIDMTALLIRCYFRIRDPHMLRQIFNPFHFYFAFKKIACVGHIGSLGIPPKGSQAQVRLRRVYCR